MASRSGETKCPKCGCEAVDVHVEEEPGYHYISWECPECGWFDERSEDIDEGEEVEEDA